MSAQQALRDGIPITEEALDLPLVDVLVSRVCRVKCSFPSYLTHKSLVMAGDACPRDGCSPTRFGACSVIWSAPLRCSCLQRLNPTGVGGVVVNWANSGPGSWPARFVEKHHLTYTDHARFVMWQLVSLCVVWSSCH